jgi:hypothetical protein
VEDLIEELIVAGFYLFARATAQLVYEFGSEVVGIVSESCCAKAPADAERLLRLRRWNERIRSR